MRLNNQNGFTLVELSIVLIVITLILGTVLGLGNAQIQASKINSTKQKQQIIKLALANFISRNNRLPCPAIATLAKGDVGYGVETIDRGTCAATNVNGLVATGIVPFTSLGITDETASDGFYNRFTYQVTLTATNTNEQTIVGLRGASTTHTATPTQLRSTPNGNQSNDCNPQNTPYNPSNDVVVIISHGTNGNGAYTEDGVQKALPVGADELENADNDSAFVIKDYSEITNNPFDDIVSPITTNDLLSTLTANGSIKNVRASINDDVNDIKNAIIAYSATKRTTIPATVTTPSFTNYPIPADLSLVSLPNTSTTDPWGGAYAYTPDAGVQNITSATDGALNVFEIRSGGAGGVFNDTDDVVTTITVNELQGEFAKVGW
jgi:prepilin-type N-terminal cleavage/methylation domain-containing protein